MVFCAFSLENVLLATAACNFRHRNFKKALRSYRVLYIFTSKCAFHHLAACNFWFIRWPHDSAPAALTALLFDWPDTRIIEKTQPFATSLTLCIFFLLTFALLHLLSSDFTASHLLFICFSTLHIVGSLLFKFPMTSIHFNALKKSIHHKYLALLATTRILVCPFPPSGPFLEGHFLAIATTIWVFSDSRGKPPAQLLQLCGGGMFSYMGTYKKYEWAALYYIQHTHLIWVCVFVEDPVQ